MKNLEVNENTLVVSLSDRLSKFGVHELDMQMADAWENHSLSNVVFDFKDTKVFDADAVYNLIYGWIKSVFVRNISNKDRNGGTVTDGKVVIRNDSSSFIEQLKADMPVVMHCVFA